MDTPILFEDDSILVIDKPAGLPVLPDGWEQGSPFIVKNLTPNYGKLFVVHRLDKGTSGVLILARNPSSHRTLNILFENHQIIKKYQAIINGSPNWIEISASYPFKVNSGHEHRTRIDWMKGKQARTNFQVIRSSTAFALIEAIPESGRTHQIRVHVSALGFPVLGDHLYGAPPTLIIQRPALHAISIQFQHPVNQQWIEFSAPYPQDFRLALSNTVY